MVLENQVLVYVSPKGYGNSNNEPDFQLFKMDRQSMPSFNDIQAMIAAQFELDDKLGMVINYISKNNVEQVIDDQSKWEEVIELSKQENNQIMFHIIPTPLPTIPAVSQDHCNASAPLLEVTNNTEGYTNVEPARDLQPASSVTSIQQITKPDNKMDLVLDVIDKKIITMEDRIVDKVVSKIQSASNNKGTTPNNGDVIQPKHSHVKCDNCMCEIVGTRYKCGNCVDYDVCQQCEALQPPVHNPSHVFLKIRTPVSNCMPLVGVCLLPYNLYEDFNDKFRHAMRLRKLNYKLRMGTQEIAAKVGPTEKSQTATGVTSPCASQSDFSTLDVTNSDVEENNSCCASSDYRVLDEDGESKLSALADDVLMSESEMENYTKTLRENVLILSGNVNKDFAHPNHDPEDFETSEDYMMQAGIVGDWITCSNRKTENSSVRSEISDMFCRDTDLQASVQTIEGANMETVQDKDNVDLDSDVISPDQQSDLVNNSSKNEAGSPIKHQKILFDNELSLTNSFNTNTSNVPQTTTVNGSKSCESPVYPYPCPIDRQPVIQINPGTDPTVQYTPSNLSEQRGRTYSQYYNYESNDKMTQLVGMGFCDRKRNADLLRKHNDDINRVVEELVALQNGDDWFQR